ncbi:MAG: lamin tail domain-containing protein, partial [Candidatus Acidiferrales bacterium]
MSRRSPFALGALILLCASMLPSLVQGVSTSVVISEFRTRGPLGGNDEFIELYNLSSSAVNIGGWEIHGSNNAAGGTLTPRATIPAGTMLNPGCHYLFTNSGSNGYSGSVPGNQTYGTGITDDGGIALTLPDDSVVDMVGMSAGSAFKEGTPLASLGSTTASNLNRGYERKPGGSMGSGQDTDDNAADFQLLAPSDPQNLSSACIDSGGPTDPSGVGAADPDSVDPGDSTLLTVAVTPGSNPTSTGLMVAGDLSTIGGSASQSFFDDGTSGDATADDLTFTFLATVSMGTTAGAKSLPVTITDAEDRTGNTTIALNVVPPVTPIHTLQGSGNASPFAGQLVRTTGIVTARRFNNGFFLQTPDADVDSDPNTSEGIFVFTSSAPPAAAAVGNLISVTGTVVEFVPAADPFQPPLTEIGGSPVVSELSTGNPLPVPVTLTAADTSPAGSIEQLERFEGMRVHVGSLTVVAPTMGFISEPNATGSSNGIFFGVITGVARPFREPGIHTLDPLPMGSPCCVPRWDGNPERLRVDSDGQVGALPPVEVTSGAVITDMVGVLDFGFRTYTILPDPGGLTVTGLVTATPVPAPALNEFTVASFNLNRFFDTVNDPAIGEPVLNAAGFERRLSKVSLAIREVMRSPDIIGVQEVENLSTLQAIADRVNADTVAAGGSNPDYQAYLEEGNDIGGIDVGLLVKMSRVIVHDVTQEGKFATFINPVSGLPETLNDRPPLGLRATLLSPIGPDVPVTFIVNHLRSLLGVDDPADGPRVRAKRAAQAEFLADLVQQRQLANPDEPIVVVGDFNAFQFSDGYVDVL